MRKRAATQADRQFRRVMLAMAALGDGEPHAFEEVAAAIGVDTDTLSSDLRAVVTRMDDVAGFIEGVRLLIDASTVQLESSLFRRPMALTHAELRALELGLAMLRHEVEPADREHVESAQRRIREAALVARDRALAPASRTGRLAGSREANHLAKLRQAVVGRVPVTIGYQSGSATSAGKRTVRPYGLVYTHGKWYLVGHCENAGEVRVFRLDRMTAVAVRSGPKFRIPPDFSLDAVAVDGGSAAATHQEVLVVRYGPGIARWIAERKQGTSEADGSIVVKYPLLNDHWAVRHVLQYGPAAEVLAPERVRNAIAAVANSITTGTEAR